MRILKRNLAFVLALVMALSLTVSAMGVEDYSDVNEIAFVEAVDVMTEMGILEGTNGVFNPEKVLNRAEAAKIIAYMLLGKNAADNLQAVTAPFADVPAKHWAAGYIAHCVNEGIINGVSATEYNPNGELTATAFAKMLLSAVGYNVNGEFTGARWETEVNALALKLGVFDGNLGAELGAGCTREEAALYAFNTLMDIETVKYSELFGTYYTGTSVLSNEGATTLNEELYDFAKKYDTDAFGREGYVWVNAKNKVVTDLYLNEADVVYTTNVKSGTIYADLGLAENVVANVIRNGVDAGEFQIKKNSTTWMYTDNGAKANANGVLTEVYVDADDNVTIVVVDTYLAKVTSATEDGEVKVTSAATRDNLFETEEEFAKDEYVLITVAGADKDIQSMIKADTVVGDLEAVSTSYIKMDGEKINKAANLDGTNWTVNYTDTMAAILDEYGYVMGLVVETEINEIEGYVWVEKAQVRSDDLFVGEAAVVKVMYLDGTGFEVLPMATKVENKITKVQTTVSGVLTWDALDDVKAVQAKTGTAVKSQFYGYYMNEEGQIVLVDLDAKVAVQGLNTNVEFKKAQTGYFNGTEAKYGKYLNSASELVLVSEKEADTTTGYKNINISETGVDVLVVYNGNLIETIYVIDGEAIESDIYAYYNGETETANNNKNNIVLYIDGAPATYVETANTVLVGTESLVKGVYVIEAEGTELTKMTLKAAATGAVVVTEADDEYFATGEATVNDRKYYAEDVKVYDIYNLGGEEGTVAKYDKVIYITSTKAGYEGLVTYAYIVGYDNSKAPIVNDGATVVEGEYTLTAGISEKGSHIAYVDLMKGGKIADGTEMTVKAYALVNGEYAYAGDAKWTAENNCYYFNASYTTKYVFKMVVGDDTIVSNDVLLTAAAAN